MHELAIAGSIVDIASRRAEGRKVTAVDLVVGHLRQVVPSALTFSFELVAEGTPVEGAQLNIRSVAAVGRCPACSFETTLEAFPFQCGRCADARLTIVAGDELIVEAIHIEEAKVELYSH